MATIATGAMHMRSGILLALVWVLMPALAGAETRYYLVEALATGAPEAPLRAQSRQLEAIYADLAAQAGVEAMLVWSNDPTLNAFATEVDGERIVIVQEGLLARFGGDRDAVAAVLGHELAHHKADHVREGRRKREGIQLFGTLLGAVVGAKVGRDSGDLAGVAAGAAVGVGTGLLVLKFSRSQELEADRMALGWMIDAGYNPTGMLRLQTSLGGMAGEDRRASILSTHPTSKKRFKAAEQEIARLNPAPELLDRAEQPLTDADDVAAAGEAIRLDQAEYLAARQAEASAAAALQEQPAPASEAEANADSSGVRIGKNVTIGKGVRVGDKPAPPSEGND